MFSMLGRLPMIILGISLAIGTFWTWLAVHDHNLRNEVITEFNTAQEKLLEETKAEFDRQVKDLENKAIILEKEINQKNLSLEVLTSELEKNMVATDANMPAAPYLKEIVAKMKKTFGDKEVKK